MSRNGAGTYTLPAGNPVTTGTTISSTWANNTLTDIASSLTASLAYDGQTAPVANLPMATYAHTGVGNATVRTMYASAGQVQDNALAYLTSVSGTDTITAIAPVSMSAYAAGQVFRFIAAGANTTTSVTLNINSIGAKAITKNGTTALAASDIPANSVVVVTYDGTQFQISNLTTVPASVSSFTAGTTGFTPSTATTGAVTLAGTLNVANGGTGATTLTSGSVIVGAGTSTPTFVAPTTAGNALFTTDGTSWSSTAKISRSTAVASTSGTSITFTSIPSWVKRITIMFNGVSTATGDNVIIQIGSTSFTTSGYLGAATFLNTAATSSNNSNGFKLDNLGSSANIRHGMAVLTNISGNIWTFNSVIGDSSSGTTGIGGGSVTASGVIDRVRITTSGGTATFAAGSINILYE
jgi:hypothetical protein